MNENKICPVCESDSITENKTNKTIQMDFFQNVSFEYNEIECSSCGYIGEADGSYPVAFSDAKRISDKEIAKNLIESNRSSGIKDAYFERCFGLPSRTLNRWKSDDSGNIPNAAAISLLKITNTYNWITEVADNGYIPEFAIQILIKNAANEFNNERKVNSLNKIGGFFEHDCGAATIMYSMEKDENDSVNIGSDYYTPLKVGNG